MVCDAYRHLGDQVHQLRRVVRRLRRVHHAVATVISTYSPTAAAPCGAIAIGPTISGIATAIASTVLTNTRTAVVAVASHIARIALGACSVQDVVPKPHRVLGLQVRQHG